MFIHQVKSAFTVAVSMVCFLSASSLQAQTPQQIVSEFFPQKLTNSARAANQTASAQNLSCFAVYNPSTIIAGYSNGVLGDVLVLQIGTDNQYHNIYETTKLQLTGEDCNVQLMDVNGDGTEEIVVSFSSLRGNTMDWVFEWNGQALTSIGPTSTDSRGNIVSMAMNSEFLDMYHDGTLQLASVGEYPLPLDGSLAISPGTLYRLTGGLFQSLPDPLLFETSINQNSIQLQSANFSFPTPATVPGPYTLNVTNGDRFGNNRMRVGTFVLNGQTVIAPSALNGTSEFVTVPIQLQAQNVLQVSTIGPVSGTLLLAVEGQPSGDVNGDGVVDCADLAIVQSSFGKKTGQPGFDQRADVNRDGVVNAIDLAIVAKQVTAGTACK